MRASFLDGETRNASRVTDYILLRILIHSPKHFIPAQTLPHLHFSPSLQHMIYVRRHIHSYVLFHPFMLNLLFAYPILLNQHQCGSNYPPYYTKLFLVGEIRQRETCLRDIWCVLSSYDTLEKLHSIKKILLCW